MLWNRQAAATHRCAFLIDESDPMNRSPAPRSQPAIPGRRREVSERERADAAAQTAAADLPPAQTPTDAAPEMSVSDSAVAPETAEAGPAESSGASASATGAGVTKAGLDAIAATGGPATAAAAAAGESRAWMVGGALGVLGLGAAAAGGGGGGKDSSPTPPSGQTPDVPKPDVPKPDVPKPDVPKPDVPKPDVPKPDVPKPDVPKPDVPKPDVPKPDVPKPDLPKPDEAKPKPDEAKPKPDETKPDPQHPDDTKPDDHKPVDPTPPDEHKPTDPQQPDGPTPDQPTPVEPPPARVQLALVNDTGSSDTDRLTHDATVRVDGIASGNSWKYSVDGGTTWVEGGADHLVPAASFLADGEQHLRVVQSNASGESSEAAELVFELDRTAPVGVPTIKLVLDTGYKEALASDRISSKGDLIVSGLDGVSAWVYSVDGGDWVRGDANHLIPEAAFGPDGHHAVQVKQVDEAGNEGAVTAYDFTLDRFAATPTLTLANAAVDTDGRIVTNGGQVLINGVEPGGGYFLERLNADTNGYTPFRAWAMLQYEAGKPTSIELTQFEIPSEGVRLHQGENTLEFSARDGASNRAKTERITFIYDTVAPDSPAVSLKHDDGASSTDKITSDATLTIAGLETSAKWKYSLDAGKTWTQGAGAELEASAITGAGEHTVQVIQTDLAGNDSAATVFTFTLDPAQSLIHPAPVI